MKIFLLVFFILCCGSSFIESANLNCQFKNATVPNLGEINFCVAQNQDDLITERSNSSVNTVNGNSIANPSVKGVVIGDSNCFYFPLGLEKFFPNLEVFQIYNSKLKEIRRENFKDYKNLRILGLRENEIKFLEPNLFEFVPKLEGIGLQKNQIAHIGANVFNNFVGKLSHLTLSGNICEFEDAENDTSKANEIIKKVQSGSCINETLLSPTTTTSTTTIIIIVVATISIIILGLILIKYRHKFL